MTPPRNVVLVTTDQQHFRTLGCTGAAEARTPHLDRLAAGGLNYRNFFVTNPVCSPSRASLATGRYPCDSGLWANGCRLPVDRETIAQTMGRAGWQTAHFGKLHLVPIINRTEPHPPYGFDVCEVSEGDQQLIDDEHFRWLRRRDPDLFVRYLNEMFLQGHAKAYHSLLPEEMHLSTWVTNRALDWLAHRRDAGRPFFLSMGFFDPHHAFNPCEPYATQFDGAAVAPPVFRTDSLAARPPHYRRRFEEVRAVTRNRAKITAIRRAYHAMVAHLDACVGRLVAALDAAGLAGDTAIVFTSDHGELLGQHGLLWKGPFLLDDLMRVPLLVAVPGRPVPPQTVDGLVSGVDLYASIQALAGVPEVRRASGRPFVDAELRPLPEGPRDFVFAEWEAPQPGPTASLRMVRTADRKLVHYGAAASEQGELYDLARDPNEFRNRYHDPRRRAEREALAARLAGEYATRRPAVPYEGGW